MPFDAAARAINGAGRERQEHRFRIAWKRCAAVVLVAIAFAACDAGPEPYANAKQVVGAMADAGIPCAHFEAGDAAAPLAEGESLMQDRGTCSIDGEDVLIATFRSSADRADWVAVGGLLGSVAMGPNWIATSRSGKVITDVVDALDATRPAGTST